MAETELPQRWFTPVLQDGLQNLGLLLLRIVPSTMMLTQHGWPKWLGYAEKSSHFPDPLHIGSPLSLALAIFAEVVCSLLVIAGLTTRLASLAIVINFAVIVWVVDAGKAFEDVELAAFYLLIYAVLLLTGPGRISLDMLLKQALGNPAKARDAASPEKNPTSGGAPVKPSK